MERELFPFAAGEQLSVSPIELVSSSAWLKFTFHRDPVAQSDADCGPLRLPCGAVVQPLNPRTIFGFDGRERVGQSHDVLLPGTSCNESMKHRGPWVEWLELGEVTQ
jgi:hypothetical protein